MEKKRFSLIITGLDDSKDIKEIVKKVNDYLQDNPFKDTENIDDFLEKPILDERLSTVFNKLHYNRDVAEKELKTKYYFGLFTEQLDEESFRKEIMNVIRRYSPYTMDVLPLFNGFIEHYNSKFSIYLENIYKSLKIMFDSNFRLFYHKDSLSTMLIVYPNTLSKIEIVNKMKKNIIDINKVKLGFKIVKSIEELKNYYLDDYSEYQGDYNE